MNLNRLRKRAFSLVELMIVVAIIGVLSTLAIQGVRRYLANAKSAEARNALGTMARNAVDAYEREKMANPTGAMAAGDSVSTGAKEFCTAATAVPSDVTKIAAKKYQSNPTDWEAGADVKAGWRCLKFSVDSPQAYQYNYLNPTAGTNGKFTAQAIGDLDGDATYSTFSIFGEATSGVARFSPSIAETNPDE